MANEPYAASFALTPHNTNKQPYMDAIYVGNNGDLVVKLKDSNTWCTFKDAEKGRIYPMAVHYISTTTGADDLVGLVYSRKSGQ